MTGKILFLPIAASILAIVPIPAFAQTAIALGERPITRPEVAAFIKKQFLAMDRNRDGHVSPEECEAYRAGQGEKAHAGIGYVGGHWFEKTDADGDGRVSLQEALERPLRMFDMADVNRDGRASVDEQSLAMMFSGK